MHVRKSFAALIGVLGLALAGTASAGTVSVANNLSFTGTFNNDDDVQLFNFTVSAQSIVTLISLSYAGGVNTAGAIIPEGGFDPILTLFSSSGTFIGRNDDGDDGSPGACLVPASAVTMAEFDTCFETLLDPGAYIVAIQQFDNFTLGNLSDGFTRAGGPNFTAEFGCSNGQFCDVSGFQYDMDGNPIGGSGVNRTNAWAFDILNVDSATVVPLPASLWFLATGIAGLVLRARKKVLV